MNFMHELAGAVPGVPARRAMARGGSMIDGITT